MSSSVSRFLCRLLADLFLAGRGSLSIVAVSARVALTDACGLTAQSTQVVKLCASDATAFYEIDVVDDRCATKILSTPTPKLVFRTVIVSRAPPCLRAITTPSKPATFWSRIL